MVISKTKYGQLKIQQMSFMLLAVTLFFVLVGLLILTIRLTSLQGQATDICEENALLLISRLANSPEFSCENIFDEPRINCIDSDKIMALERYIDEYEDFWGIDGIEIRKIYPSGEKVCTPTNYPNCEIIKLKPEKGTYVGNFVALCKKKNIDREITNYCELAKLMVSYKGATC